MQLIQFATHVLGEKRYFPGLVRFQTYTCISYQPSGITGIFNIAVTVLATTVWI